MLSCAFLSPLLLEDCILAITLRLISDDAKLTRSNSLTCTPRDGKEKETFHKDAVVDEDGACRKDRIQDESQGENVARS